MKIFALLLTLFSLIPLFGAEDLSKFLGSPAPDWMNFDPLELADSKGRVVLLHLWLVASCPFCEATAPALNEWYDRYKDKGLVIGGLYHHESDEAIDVLKVQIYVRRLEFKFPVAIDRGWKTLQRWWLEKYP